jgi:hypothetical protein
VHRVLLGVALLLTLGAGSASAAGGTSFFQMPSKNIGCVYLAPDTATEKPYLRCDIGGGLRPLPPRPRNCDLDWGYGYQMSGPAGRAKPFCAGDTARDPRAPVLAYGRTWRRGPFRCLSRTIGLRCTNRAGHGFFLSRQRSYTF